MIFSDLQQQLDKIGSLINETLTDPNKYMDLLDHSESNDYVTKVKETIE